MISSSRRIVITGLGVVSPFGTDINCFWQGLVDGRSAVAPLTHIDASALACRFGAYIADFAPKKLIPDQPTQKRLRDMSRTVQLGVAAAQRAFDSRALPKERRDPTRCGVEFGTSMIHTELDDISRAAKASTPASGIADLKPWGAGEMKQIPPTWMLKYLPNMPACHAAITHDLQGPSNTHCSGDVGSLLAFAEAARILERGTADLFLVGGCESRMNPLNLLRQSLFQPLSRRNEAPADAVRPFDRRRDGTALGESAVAFTVETLAHARATGATIHGEWVGFACGFDRAKQGRGLAQVIRRALSSARIAPDDIDHVNAHGLGTVSTDQWEASALAEVFGTRVPVWAMKGALGASGPAGGVTELLGSLLAMKHGRVPPTRNCDDPDPACGIAVLQDWHDVRKPYALKVSMTELGHVAAAVVRRFDD